MNQKIYDEFAKINKRNKKWFANEEVHALYCEQQVDCLEKEERITDAWGKVTNRKGLISFRKQFLKKSGVD